MAKGKMVLTNNFGEKTSNFVGAQIVSGKTGTPEYTFASGAGLFSGTGVPTITANAGSMYLRTDGSDNNTVLYVTFNGTTWAPLTGA